MLTTGESVMVFLFLPANESGVLNCQFLIKFS